MAAPYRKPFTPQQKLWVKCVVAGDSRAEIAQKVFHADPNNSTDMHRVDACIYRWKRHPDYEKEWKAAYRELWGEITFEAVKELRKGLRDEQLPWRRTQHVNLALSYGSKILDGEDANTVKVQITGMPDIGSPADDEQDV